MNFPLKKHLKNEKFALNFEIIFIFELNLSKTYNFYSPSCRELKSIQDSSLILLKKKLF